MSAPTALGRDERSQRWITRAACGAPAAVAVCLAVLALRWHSVHDAQVMNYLGWRVLDGDRPYVDAVDMNFPGAYLLHAALVGMGGDIDVTTAVANGVLLASVAVLCGLLVGRAGGGWAVAWTAGAAAVIAVMKSGPYDILQRDTLTIPLLLGATLVLTTRADRMTGALRGLLAGALIGGATTIKPAAAAWGGAALLTAGLAEARLGVGDATRLYAAGALGLVLAWAPVLGWLALCGSLRPFVAMVREYLPVYTAIDHAVILGASAPNRWLLVRDELARTDLLALVRGWGVLVSIGALMSKDWQLRILAASMLGALAGFFAQGKGWAYHQLPAYVAAIAIAAYVWSRAHRMARRRSWWRPLHVVTMLALAALTASGLRAIPGVAADRITPKTTQVLALAEYLVRHPFADDSIQVIDSTVGGLDLLLRLRRRNTTPLVYDFHVLFGGDETPWVAALRANVLDRWRAAPPARVLVFRHGWPRAGYERLDRFPALAALLRADYQVELESEEFRLLRRRGDGGRAMAAARSALSYSAASP